VAPVTPAAPGDLGGLAVLGLAALGGVLLAERRFARRRG